MLQSQTSAGTWPFTGHTAIRWPHGHSLATRPFTPGHTAIRWHEVHKQPRLTGSQIYINIHPPNSLTVIFLWKMQQIQC